jgi:predicted Zn-dependent peptidase
MVLVQAGSKYETKEVNGLSHFLEHMCFKGTTQRPSQFVIASELDGLGAEYNAFTGLEHTGYFAKVRNGKFDEILTIISDLYLNPIFDPAEIEKERGPIIEEINMYEDLPMRRVQELFFDVVYGDQPAGWSIAGTKENIRQLVREDFIHYRTAHYVAGASIVVIAGGFDLRGVEEKVERAFTTLTVGAKAPKVPVVEGQTQPQFKVIEKQSDQTHLVLGFRAIDIHDDRRFALQLLADLLGGGMSSRLFQRIRTEMGAAYYVKAEADLFTDHGVMTMAAGVDHAKLTPVIKAGIEEFVKLKDQLVGEEELRRRVVVLDHDGIGVGRLDAGEVVHRRGRGVLLPDLADREDDVVDGDVLAVVKLHAFADLHGVGLEVR